MGRQPLLRMPRALGIPLIGIILITRIVVPILSVSMRIGVHGGIGGGLEDVALLYSSILRLILGRVEMHLSLLWPQIMSFIFDEAGQELIMGGLGEALVSGNLDE